LVQNITDSSRDQHNATIAVNTSTQQLSSIANSNSVLAEELAANSEELTTQAEQLNATVGYFKTDLIIKPTISKEPTQKKQTQKTSKFFSSKKNNDDNKGVIIDIGKGISDDGFEKF